MSPHDATRGFDQAAEEYERGRPSFPEDAVAALADECRVRASSTVIELGAGTGKFTRQLWRRSAKWIAVEPMAGMRAILEETIPEIDIYEGTAESIPLPDASCDVVLAAQCFHWFRGVEALGEIHRILRPQGRLGLIWNVRDDETSWVAELTTMLEQYRGTTPSYASMDWRRSFTTSTLFTHLNERAFPFAQNMDVDMLVDRVASISFVALLPDEEKQDLFERVKALVADHATFFDMPYVTDIYWCTRR